MKFEPRSPTFPWYGGGGGKGEGDASYKTGRIFEEHDLQDNGRLVIRRFGVFLGTRANLSTNESDGTLEVKGLPAVLET